MTNVVNLRQARKARMRSDREKAAAENRARFGRTKEQRIAQSLEERRKQQAIDGAKREDKTVD